MRSSDARFKAAQAANIRCEWITVALLGQDLPPQMSGKKHISGVVMPIITVATIIKNIFAHLKLFYNVQW